MQFWDDYSDSTVPLQLDTACSALMIQCCSSACKASDYSSKRKSEIFERSRSLIRIALVTSVDPGAPSLSPDTAS